MRLDDKLMPRNWMGTGLREVTVEWRGSCLFLNVLLVVRNLPSQEGVFTPEKQADASSKAPPHPPCACHPFLLSPSFLFLGGAGVEDQHSSFFVALCVFCICCLKLSLRIQPQLLCPESQPHAHISADSSAPSLALVGIYALLYSLAALVHREQKVLGSPGCCLFSKLLALRFG